MKSLKFTQFILISFFLFLGFNTPNIYAQVQQNFSTAHKISLVEGNKRSLLLLPPQLNTVEISNLEVGENYMININKDDVVNACSPEVSMFDVNNNKISFSSSFEFTAYSNSLILSINPNCVNPYKSRLAFYLSVSHRGESAFQDKHLSDLNTRGPSGPLIGSSSLAIYSLVTDILVGDPNIQVSNINAIGGAQQIGTFESGGSSINMESGVLITSGSCSVASGPNNAGGATGGGGGGSDPDLSTLSLSAAIFDAGGIEFDFIPVSSNLEFNYVFGSEEYEEYTCSQFNDVFGLFLTAENDTARNIAIIPGTDIPVRINTVNQGSVGVFGFIANCTLPLGTLAYAGFYVSNPLGSPDVQYDGFTKVLTAEATVIPCKKYHLKMVVGDAGDGVFDSGVFIEAKSLNTGSNYYTEVFTGNSQTDTLYESCNDGYIHFKRVNNINFDQDLIIPLTIDQASTATEGLDYSNLPSTVTIPAGEDEYILDIHILKDFVPEGTETIIFTQNNACSNGSNTITFYINDTYSISIDTSESYLCINDSIGNITASADGGIGNYTYLWSNGASDKTIQILTSDPPKYSVTVTDACGNTATTELSVKITENPTAQIEGFGTLCPFPILQNEVLLTVNFTGLGPWNLYYLRDGYPQMPILNISTNPYILHVVQDGNYTIDYVEGSFGCKGSGFGVATVDTATIAMLPAIVIDTSICYNDTLIINNQQISTAGIYDFLSQENNQCKHYHYNVTIKNVSDTLFNICTGEFVTIANQNYNKGGDYIATIPQALGCDSVIYITIKEYPKYQKISNISVSKGSIFKGFVINTDTTFVENLTTQYGCDSLIITHVMVITATNNLLDNYTLKASPNPATKQLNISADGQLILKEWSIIDLLGFKIMASNKDNILPLSIDLSSLTAGYYWWVGQNELGKVAVS
ncbi:MAG TPA: choice-of-anchor L domain-containing protein, partial [Saprospiraceae bacterium]|nr:choice-of-anchor L domain-containing protein [Saprospiraceae bacterium]